MKFQETRLRGAYIIDLEKRCDDRGYFARVWCREEFAAHGLKTDVVQANLSYSRMKGTLRGLHYQAPPSAETKVVRSLRGAIYDVIVDLREQSPTFGEWIGVELTAGNGRMLYVPEGFAHGFQTLEPDSEVQYLVSEFYSPEHERGVRWNDPAFAIEWRLGEPAVISEKDSRWEDYELPASLRSQSQMAQQTGERS